MPSKSTPLGPPCKTPKHIRYTHLCRGLDLGQLLALLESLLLLEAHNLEAVEVGEALPPGDLRALLGPVGLRPLGVDLVLLPLLLEGGVTGTAEEALDLERREESLGEGERLPGDSKFGV